MSRSPKLILLNGFPAIGKSTIAKKYIDEHPFTFIIDDDQLVVMLGRWTKHENTARELIFELTKSMASTYLRFGHSVLVPYLLLHPKDAAELEEVARKQNAQFFERFLSADKDEAITRLLRRGTWGEFGLPPISDKDIPYIKDMYDKMEAALKRRPATEYVQSLENDIDSTYKQFIVSLEDDVDK